MVQRSAFCEFLPSGDFDVVVPWAHLLRTTTIKFVAQLMKEEADLTTPWQTPQIQGCYKWRFKGVFKGTPISSSEDKWNQKTKEMFEN